MQITRISAKYERKINPELLNPRQKYESITFEQSVWAEIEENEDQEKVQKMLFEICKNGVRGAAKDTILAIAQRNKKSRVSLADVETAFKRFTSERLGNKDPKINEELLKDFADMVLLEASK